MKDDCLYIVKEAIARVLPDEAVKRALGGREFPDGRLILVSVGKAAWSMASAAHSVLGTRIDRGIVITKHGYSRGAIGDLSVREAGKSYGITASSPCSAALPRTPKRRRL